MKNSLYGADGAKCKACTAVFEKHKFDFLLEDIFESDAVGLGDLLAQYK